MSIGHLLLRKLRLRRDLSVSVALSGGHRMQSLMTPHPELSSGLFKGLCHGPEFLL